MDQPRGLLALLQKMTVNNMPRIMLIYSAVRWWSLFSGYPPLSGAFRSVSASKSSIQVFCLSPSWDLFLRYTIMIRGLTVDAHWWEVAGTLQKSQSIQQKLWTNTALGNHVLADDWFRFPNMDMQHIQHYAWLQFARKDTLPSYHKMHSVSWNGSWRVTTKPRLEAWELCVRIFPPLTWMWTCGKHLELLPSRNPAL